MNKIFRFSYTVLLYIFFPFLLILMNRYARKMHQDWEYFSRERFGSYKCQDNLFRKNRPIWIHAASLGETKAIAPLIASFLREGWFILLTNTTPSGKEQGYNLFKKDIKNGKLIQAWFPYDFPRSMRNFLEYYNPCFGILTEREIWPNLLSEARIKKIPMFLANARLSERSLRKVKQLNFILKTAYNSLALVLAQTKEDAHRLTEAGVCSIFITGNLKFDSDAMKSCLLEQAKNWKNHLRKKIIVLSCVREGENILFLDAIRKMNILSENYRKFFYVIVPRHSSCFSSTFLLLKNSNIKFECRTDLKNHYPSKETSILLGNTFGEMSFYYGLADIAVIGGSFLPLGGHNLIEACKFGVPTILGPYNFNFQEVSKSAIKIGAALKVENSIDALEKAIYLLENDFEYDSMKNSAEIWVNNHKGATRKTIQAITSYYNKWNRS